MTLAFVPRTTGVRQLAKLGFSPGVMSAGLGTVPALQTYLDITQGNRVFDSLYDQQLPSEGACGPRFWSAVTNRADSAPADIVPGLLTQTLEAARIGVRVGVRAACAFSAPRPRTARGEAPEKLSEGPHPNPSAGELEVRSGSLRSLSSLTGSLRAPDLLVAIARPTGESDEPLPIGIAGEGFDGNLTSDSTRTAGYVLSTDVGPTILERFGIPVPSQMSGQTIRSEGSVDPAAIDELVARMDVISSRRGPVIGYSLAAWMVALVLIAGVSRGRLSRTAVRIVGLSVVYLPLTLLVGAGVEPGQGAEQVLVAFGAPLLALLTLAVLPGYRALGLASGAAVFAYALDVIAGSPLTSRSLLGPNPGLGARFYGIGNELEALLAVLVVAGTGAALAGFGPRLSRRGSAVAFLVVGMPLAFVFAAGWFGADVGAAIVLPIGSAAAAAIASGRRRAALLVVAVPLLALALLALIDLVSGANAHLTRTVLDAGGLNGLGQVAQRRLELSAHSFARPVVFAFLPLVAAAALLATFRRDRLRAWTRGLPTVRAGLLGALVATLAGTLANDSGALLLVVGSAYLLVFAGYAWAESGTEDPARPIHYP